MTQIVIPPPGLRGFDCNCMLTASTARAFVAKGFDFVMRYVPRVRPGPHDLTDREVDTLLTAGLDVGTVQHVENVAAWTPTAGKGTLYGQTAATYARFAGMLPGCIVALDLEGVALDTPAEVTIAYCRNWYAVVKDAGFLPVLYVGWRCGLSPAQLYHNLPFSRYWGAYNLNRDQFPAVRGVCMKQSERIATDIPPGVTFGFDVNTIRPDALGGMPVLLGR